MRDHAVCIRILDSPHSFGWSSVEDQPEDSSYDGGYATPRMRAGIASHPPAARVKSFRRTPEIFSPQVRWARRNPLQSFPEMVQVFLEHWRDLTRRGARSSANALHIFP